MTLMEVDDRRGKHFACTGEGERERDIENCRWVYNGSCSRGLMSER